MSSPPMVTFVLPVHDGLPHLHEAVASVMAQTCPDWRLLVVDDASTDGSADVIGAFDDPRIGVIRHAKSVGVYATVVEAVAHVDTEWVAILMQDDRLHPAYLSALVSLVARLPADAFWICGDTLDESGRVVERGLSSGRVEPIRPGVRPWRRALTSGGIWRISGSFTRRSLLEEVPFRADLAHCADYDWFLRAARLRPFVYYQRPLIDVRRHNHRNIAEMCAVMEEQLDQYPRDLSFPRVCAVAARRAWQCGLTRTAIRFLLLPPRVIMRRWAAWRPDLPAAEEL